MSKALAWVTFGVFLAAWTPGYVYDDASLEPVVDRFARSLSDGVNAENVVDGWLGVVLDAMQPVSAGVWRETR